MSMRNRTGALTALAAACLTAVTALAAPASAATRAPGFLSAADLPPHSSSSWTAGQVTPGVPEEVELDVCLNKALPGRGGTWYRTFRTDLDTGARQVSVVLRSEGAAKALVARLNKDIRSCAARMERAHPDVEAEFRDFGGVRVEEGAHVYGLHTETSWGATDVRLLSVGRDGRTVTVVDWGQLGDFRHAPVKEFKKTTVTAVNKLY
ncbi:hypothetical protein [Streptomyces sp. NPDC018693]|uniref:hypothetical protein n=1 Tax=unclassified Streptomyces TaxID=2593676 RepID=UPI00379B2C47